MRSRCTALLGVVLLLSCKSESSRPLPVRVDAVKPVAQRQYRQVLLELPARTNPPTLEEFFASAPLEMADDLVIIPKHYSLAYNAPRREFWGVELGRALAKEPRIAKLRSLMIYDELLGDEGVAELAKIPFERLESLDLSRHGIGDPGVAALSASPHLDHLKVLNLSGSVLSDAGARSLMRGAFVPTLEELILSTSSGKLGPDGAIALAASPGFVKLRVLHMNNAGGIGAAGAKAIASSPSLRKLETLGVQGCRLGEEGVRALATADWPNLEELFISETRVLAAELDRDSKSSRLPRLSRVGDWPFLSTAALRQAIQGDILMSDVDLSRPALTSVLKGVREIHGSLTITSGGDLRALEALRIIRGSLRIEDPELTSLQGLQNLEEVGGTIWFSRLRKLKSTRGLKNLRYIGGDLGIQSMKLGNPSLKDFSGFEELQRIGGSLVLEDGYLVHTRELSTITSLGAFPALEVVGGDLLLKGVRIEKLVAFPSLRSIGGSLILSETSLKRVSDFQNLEHVGVAISFEKNPKLTSVRRFAELKSVREIRVCEKSRTRSVVARALEGRGALTDACEKDVEW